MSLNCYAQPRMIGVFKRGVCYTAMYFLLCVLCVFWYVVQEMHMMLAEFLLLEFLARYGS